MVISEFILWIPGMCFDPGESQSQIKFFYNFVYCRRPRPGVPQSLNGRLTVSMDIDPDPVFQSPAHRKINCSQLSLKNRSAGVKHVIRTKRRGLLLQKVVLLYDNAGSHTAVHSLAETIRLSFEVLQHPPYSPDLSPSICLHPSKVHYVDVTFLWNTTSKMRGIHGWSLEQKPSSNRESTRLLAVGLNRPKNTAKAGTVEKCHPYSITTFV
ncbi:hypothetical protein AVEN_212630-1 [Araneus ventricosus]|uniref:Uncharacterized protein n=1 Tax=Araneus ventricosus TaxID=182803 RepID=A0A4Y2LLC3_ARAVE|nr:hypothetical protein AVEN_212630-1 [Araneus ventricosus]